MVWYAGTAYTSLTAVVAYICDSSNMVWYAGTAYTSFTAMVAYILLGTKKNEQNSSKE